MKTSCDDTEGVQNALAVGGLMLLPTLLGVAGIAGARVVRQLQEHRRRALVTGPSIERLATDLRRLHAQLSSADEPVPRPGRGLRIRATRGAYVDALTAACRTLEVAPPQASGTGEVPVTEIYRVEAALRSAGLDVRGSEVR